MLRAHVTHVPICTAALRACKHVLALSDEPLKVFLRMRGTQVKARTARACVREARRMPSGLSPACTAAAARLCGYCGRASPQAKRLCGFGVGLRMAEYATVGSRSRTQRGL